MADKTLENYADYAFESELTLPEDFLPLVSNAVIVESTFNEDWNSENGEEIYTFPVDFTRIFDDSVYRSFKQYRDYVEVTGDSDLLYRGVPFLSGTMHNSAKILNGDVKYYYPKYSGSAEYTNGVNTYKVIGTLDSCDIIYNSSQKRISGEFTYFIDSLIDVIVVGNYQTWNSGSSSWESVDYRTVTLSSSSINAYKFTISGSVYLWSGGRWVFQSNDTVNLISAIGTFTGNGVITLTSFSTIAGYIACWDENLIWPMSFDTDYVSEGNQYDIDINLPKNTDVYGVPYSEINVKRNNPLPEEVDSGTIEFMPLSSPKLCFVQLNKTFEIKDKFKMYYEGTVYKKAPVLESGTKQFSKYDDTYTPSGTTYTISVQDHSIYPLSGYTTQGNDMACRLLSKICPPGDYHEAVKYEK